MAISSVIASLLMQCQTSVDPKTLESIISVESSGNQYAVAIVQKKEDKNFINYKIPTNLEDAKALVQKAKANNKRYSVGLMQVNSINFKEYGLNDENMFDSCTNLKAGANILKDYYLIAKEKNPNKTEQENLRIATSLYYSGNPLRGFKKEGKYSYVDKINNTLENTKQGYVVPKIEKISNTITDVNVNNKQEVEPPQQKIIHEWDVFNDFSKN